MSFTKLYIRPSDGRYLPPTIRGTWNDTSNYQTGCLYTSKVYGGQQSTGAYLTESSATNPYKGLFFRGASQPIGAQTLSGTVDVASVVLAILDGATASCYYAMHLYVTVGNTDVVRGTLINNFADSSNVFDFFDYHGQALSAPQTMSSVVAQDGDRIVLELGYASRNSSTNTTVIRTQLSATNSLNQPYADVVVGNTYTGSAAAASFITFSNAITEAIAPSNDACSGATVISALPYSAVQDNETATTSGDPAVTFILQPLNTVWYKWVADRTGRIAIDYPATATDLTFSVFSGTACGALTEIAGTDRSSEGDTEFDAVLGTTYYIMRGSQSPIGESITLSVAERTWTSHEGVAKTAVYSEAFAAGNSTVMQNSYYERVTTGSDPLDPLYPLVISSESVQVDTGTGPSGENVLTRWTGVGADPDWGTLGLAMVQVGDLYPGRAYDIGAPHAWGSYLNVQQGYVAADWRFPASGRNANMEGPFYTISNDFNNSWFITLSLWNNASYGGTEASRYIELYYRTWTDGGNYANSYFLDIDQWLDEWHNWELKWKLGTVTTNPLNATDVDAVATDGWIEVLVDGVAIYRIEGIDLYSGNNLSYDTALAADTEQAYYANALWLGYYGMPGEVTNVEMGRWTDALVTPPLMQRASYVFFSNELVEKQTETRLSRTYLQLLATDSPVGATPVSLSLTQVTGYVYDSNGNQMSTGRLYIKPKNFIVVDGTYVFGTETTTYNVTGPLSLNLAPSSTVTYTVEFDPDPTDSRPMNLKIGYWKNTWTVPDVASIDIADL